MKNSKGYAAKLLICIVAALTALNLFTAGIYAEETPSPGNGGPRQDASVSPTPFSDINTKQWYYTALVTAYNNGIIDKYSGTRFRPNDPITLAELLKMLVAASDLQDPGEEAPGALYVSYIDRALELGFIDAAERTDYRRPVTKAEAAVILCRFLGLDAAAPRISGGVFEDTDDPYAALLYTEGLLTPYPTGGKRYFAPESPVTRAQAVTLITRALSYKKSPADYKYLQIFKSRAKVRLPMLTYHEISEDPALWNDFVVSPEKLRGDLEALLDSGFTPIHFSDLLAFMDGYAELPDRPVIISFDDGYKGNYDYAFKLAREIDIKFTVALVGITVGDIWQTDSSEFSFSHLTEENIKEMHRSGLVEFNNHTFDLHKNTGTYSGSGINRFQDEAEEAYIIRLREDIQKNSDYIYSLLGLKPEVFVYPMGYHSSIAEELLKEMGFRATLVTSGGTNLLDDGTSLMKRINASYAMSSGELLEALKE